MDEPALDAALHRQALAGLARLNFVGRSADILWRALGRERRRGAPLRLLDLACGGGDVLLALARRARRSRLPWTFAGVDKSEVALDYAREQARRANLVASFVACDLLSDGWLETPVAKDVDVVVCSLFLHHLSDSDAVSMLHRAAAVAQSKLLVSDLNRSVINRWLTWWGCHLLTRSPVVHFDGPASIRAAFSHNEARQLATVAGLDTVTVSMRLPARWLLEWERR